MSNADMTSRELEAELVRLRQRVTELEDCDCERRQLWRNITAITDCFASLGRDPLENIKQLTALCGQTMGAVCAIYNRLYSGMLCSIGQWSVPPDYNELDKADGHICYDVIEMGLDEPMVIRDLQNTSYAQTDPNVANYNLKTYVGKAVFFEDHPVGSLCVVYQEDFVPTSPQMALMAAVANAIGLEERRKSSEDLLLASELRWRQAVQNSPNAILSVDAGGKILSWNSSCEKVTGYLTHEVEGQDFGALLLTQSGQQYLREIIEDVFRGKSFKDFEQVFRCKDGQGRQMLSRAYPVCDAEGRIVECTLANTDISERARAEERLRCTLREKETLLREIHHRVKNNLQVMSSLLALQSSYHDDEVVRKASRDSERRIWSMALVHESLYKSNNLAEVESAKYIERLAQETYAAYVVDPSRVTLRTQVANSPLGLDKALNIGLIVNELVSNSLKHGFPDNKSGVVCVSFGSTAKGAMELKVSDNGGGIPPGISHIQGNSFGLDLVRMLIDELSGTMEVVERDGTEFRITF